MDSPDSEEMHAVNSDDNDRQDLDTMTSRESSLDIFPATKVRWDPLIIEIYPEYFDDESGAEDEEDIAASEDADNSEDENALLLKINPLLLMMMLMLINLITTSKFDIKMKIKTNVCGNCQRRDHSTIISLNTADDESTAFDIEKNHVCDPIDFDTKQLFDGDHFRVVDEQLLVKRGDDQFVKYCSLEPSNNFLCIDCEASGIHNEAVLYHDNGGNWFAECDSLHVCQAGENGTVEREADSNNDFASNAGNMSVQEPSDFDHDFDNGSYGGDMNPSGSYELLGNEKSFPGCGAEDENNFQEEGNAEQSDESQMMDSFEHCNRDSTLQGQMVGSAALNSAGSASEDVEVENDGREEDVDSDDQQIANKSQMVLRKRHVLSCASEDAEEIVAKRSKQSKPKSKSARQAVSAVPDCEEGDAQIKTQQKRNRDTFV